MIARRGRQCGWSVYPHWFRHNFSHTWLGRGGAEGDLMEKLNGWDWQRLAEIAWFERRHGRGLLQHGERQQIIGVSFWASKESCEAWRASESEARRREAMAPRIVDEQEAFYRGRELIVPAR